MEEKSKKIKLNSRKKGAGKIRSAVKIKEKDKEEIFGGGEGLQVEKNAKIEDILAETEKEDKAENVKQTEKSKEKAPSLTYRTPIRLYRRIALFFTLATFLILVCALYFSLSRAEIIVTPHKYLVNAEFNVNVEKVPLSENSVAGFVTEDIRSTSMGFDIEGEGQVKEGAAKGEVTIFNKMPANQILVKTTRLLSGGGVLFRLSERVSVPANGSVTASVYADQPGAGGDIGPTKFTIPGLSPSLQDKVYAVSEEAMHGGKVVIKTVREEDINRAKNVLKEKIISEVKENLNKSFDETRGLVFWPEVLNEQINAKAGDEKESFEVSMKIKTPAVIYDKNALEKMAREKVNLVVPAGRTIKEVLLQDIEIDLVRYDASSESAVIKVSVPASAIIKNNAEVLNKEQLVGLKKGDAKKYLEDFEEIESVEIKTRPFWLRCLPSTAERIKLYIQ
jgi:hypothetical protein